jgi:hypothetical protein
MQLPNMQAVLCTGLRWAPPFSDILSGLLLLSLRFNDLLCANAESVLLRRQNSVSEAGQDSRAADRIGHGSTNLELVLLASHEMELRKAESLVLKQQERDPEELARSPLLSFLSLSLSLSLFLSPHLLFIPINIESILYYFAIDSAHQFAECEQKFAEVTTSHARSNKQITHTLKSERRPETMERKAKPRSACYPRLNRPFPLPFPSDL